ncbi:MAG: restriction endonuclease subunit S [Ruminococcus sp.]|nr:restriction endonuclease subunit S [Ruminococcus sp.]
MKSEWKNFTIGELCDTVSDTYKRSDRQVILINTSDVLDGKVLNHSPVENENLKGQFKKTFKRDDILYSEIRPANRRFAYIDFDNTENYIASTKLMVLRPRKEVVLPRFLYNILKSQTLINKLQHLAETRSGTFPQITFSSELAPMRVEVPDLKTQHQIASVLSALDDKIELNNRINKNLEEQAQAIFKSWFVDFEPFGGVMPDNWKITTLGEICSCVLGGTPSRKNPEYWNGNISWINSGEVNRFRITSPSEFITKKGLNSSSTKLLPEKTTVLAITGATLGKVSLLEIESCANQSVVGIIPNENLPYEFIFPFIKTNIKQLTLHQTGGAQQHINKQNVESLPVYIPHKEDIKKYKNIVNPIYNLISNNCFENQRLSALRDALLPKLMNDEIDVSEVKI